MLEDAPSAWAAELEAFSSAELRHGYAVAEALNIHLEILESPSDADFDAALMA
jgi:hypothetical protein